MHDFNIALNDAHNQSLQLHLLMESHFDQMRAIVSSQLTLISAQTLDHILQGVDAGQQLNALGCIEINPINRKQEIGAGISSCSSEADLTIQRMTQHFFDALEGPQEISTQVLNLVLSEFGNFNPIDNADQISELTDSIREVQERFTNVTLTMLQDELELVSQLTIDIPSRAKVCVAEVLAAFAFTC